MHLSFNLVFLGFLQVIHVIIVAHFYPFLSLITAIFAVLQMNLRTLYDKLMFRCVIKPKAMVPSRDTNLARKIAGPGVSKNLYYTLKIEDSI